MVVAGGPRRYARTPRSKGRCGSGATCSIGAGVRLMGPMVLGDGAQVGDGAQLRGSSLFPGTEIAPEAILIGAISGHGGILQSLRRRER